MLLYALVENLVDCPDIAFADINERQNQKAQHSGFCYLGAAFVDASLQLGESWVERTGWKNAWRALLICARTSRLVANVSWRWSQPKLVLAGQSIARLYRQADDWVQQPLYENYQFKATAILKIQAKQVASFYETILRKPVRTA